MDCDRFGWNGPRRCIASVSVAVLMAIASIAVLIYFIHHISISLQAPNVVGSVRADLFRVIDQSARDQKGTGVPLPGIDEGLPENFEAESCPVAATRTGYVQPVDYDDLLREAADGDLLIRLEYRPGDYVIEGNSLMRVWPAERCGTAVAVRMNESFICSDHGTAEQDLEYAVRQIVEVGGRALSPGINDPFTAINCIDALGSAICRIARTGLAGPYRYDAAGKLRIVTPVSSFAGIVDAAFNQIRQYGQTSVAVTLRLLEVIAACAKLITSEDHRKSLLRQAEMVYQQCQSPDAIPARQDREDVVRRWEVVQMALAAFPA